MGIIYKIENKVTGKVYIGQTLYDLHKRWLQHIRESKDALDGKRQSFPLFHRMIIKYGEENFVPSTLEECDNSILDEREKYWIEFYNSQEDGYNSTPGGQNFTIDRPINQKVSKYKISGEYVCTFNSAREAAQAVGVDVSNIRRNCSGDTKTCAGFRWSWGESTEKLEELKKGRIKGRKVLQYSKEGQLIGQYESVIEASRLTGTNQMSIYNVCNKKQKTAGGFFWEFEI